MARSMSFAFAAGGIGTGCSDTDGSLVDAPECPSPPTTRRTTRSILPGTIFTGASPTTRRDPCASFNRSASLWLRLLQLLCQKILKEFHVSRHLFGRKSGMD